MTTSPPPWKAVDMGRMRSLPGNKSLIAVHATIGKVSEKVFHLIRNDGDPTRSEDYPDPRFHKDLALLLAAPDLLKALHMQHSVIENILTDSQLDTRTPCGKTIRQYIKTAEAALRAAGKKVRS